MTPREEAKFIGDQEEGLAFQLLAELALAEQEEANELDSDADSNTQQTG